VALLDALVLWVHALQPLEKTQQKLQGMSAVVQWAAGGVGAGWWGMESAYAGPASPSPSMANVPSTWGSEPMSACSPELLVPRAGVQSVLVVDDARVAVRAVSESAQAVLRNVRTQVAAVRAVWGQMPRSCLRAEVLAAAGELEEQSAEA